MKKAISLLIVFLSLSINAQDVQKLYDRRDFIQISNLDIENWEPDNFSVPFIKANTYNAMARCEESNKEIEFLLKTNEAKENPYLMTELLRLQADNYTKMFQYKQAADSYKKILDNDGNLLGETAVLYQDIFRRYDILSTVEPLQVNIPHNTIIQTKPGIKGLPQVQVRTPKDTVSLVFDTGAALSAVTKSVAKRLGIKILADSLIAGGTTANADFMSIGIADTLYLGDILYKNVVFGIFEDEKMTFPEHGFVLNGTLGLPEIKALSSIKIHKDSILEVSVNEEKYKSNMMFSGTQQIIIQVNDSLLFCLDTGAAWSSLSVNYYAKNKEYIDKTGEFTTKVVNGMGGNKEFSGYKLKDFPVKINTSATIQPEMITFIQPISVIWYEYDGTLGQDIISKYDYMLLDFRNMYFSLENINHSN
ncbi:MAG: retroviral-like aspartic protease family protein [Candidatus Azobacteroides sp.]|nr:retroviral-like aspartic protease family protein [Candidatus Azobacteroides sp.]